MQLLFEEFFRKLYRFDKGVNLIFTKFVFRAFMFFSICLIIGFIVFSIVLGRYIYILILIGLIIIGESAHYIRKTREKELKERVTKLNLKNKVDGHLVQDEVVKNKNLLEMSDIKNTKLLGSKQVVNRVKIKRKVPNGSKVLQSKNIVNNAKLERAKSEIDGNLVDVKVTAKNSNLLKINKAKNTELLKKKKS